MSLSTAIAPHLPFLRRFSRAVSGSQESGDALVAALLEAIIADVDMFPKASSDRIALYKVFAKLFTSVAIRVPQSEPQSAWEQLAAANLNALAPLPRQAFLLVSVEGFSEAEAAEILDVDEDEFSRLLVEASNEISRQVATDILIIEDEPLIAMDIEEMVESLGHRVVGTARTQAEAAGCFVDTPDGLGGTFKAPASPARFPGAKDGPRGPAPRLGEHSAEVLKSVGYSDADIAGMKAAGATA